MVGFLFFEVLFVNEVIFGGVRWFFYVLIKIFMVMFLMFMVWFEKSIIIASYYKICFCCGIYIVLVSFLNNSILVISCI